MKVKNRGEGGLKPWIDENLRWAKSRESNAYNIVLWIVFTEEIFGHSISYLPSAIKMKT